MSLAVEHAAYVTLEWLRWKDVPACGHCGSVDVSYIRPNDGTSRPTRTRTARSPRRVWRCHTCRLQFSVLTGTVLERTKVPVSRWLAAADAVALDPTISVRRLASAVGVHDGGGARTILRAFRKSEDPFVSAILRHGLERTSQ